MQASPPTRSAVRGGSSCKAGGSTTRPAAMRGRAAAQPDLRRDGRKARSRARRARRRIRSIRLQRAGGSRVRRLAVSLTMFAHNVQRQDRQKAVPFLATSGWLFLATKGSARGVQPAGGVSARLWMPLPSFTAARACGVRLPACYRCSISEQWIGSYTLIPRSARRPRPPSWDSSQRSQMAERPARNGWRRRRSPLQKVKQS